MAYKSDTCTRLSFEECSYKRKKSHNCRRTTNICTASHFVCSFALNAALHVRRRTLRLSSRSIFFILFHPFASSVKLKMKVNIIKVVPIGLKLLLCIPFFLSLPPVCTFNQSAFSCYLFHRLPRVYSCTFAHLGETYVRIATNWKEPFTQSFDNRLVLSILKTGGYLNARWRSILYEIGGPSLYTVAEKRG